MTLSSIPRGVALALVVLTGLLASCGDSDSSSPETGAATRPERPRVGEPARVGTDGTTLLVTVRKVIFPLRGSDVLVAPGDRAAAVEVAVRNVGDAVYDSSSESDLSLRTASGGAAEPTYAAGAECATSEVDFLKEVAPGESRGGCVAFDVPKGTEPTTVRFAPGGRQALGSSWLVGG